MKTIFGALLVTMLMVYQEANAALPTSSYTIDGIKYTWSCYNNDCAGGSTFIDQYQINITADLTGVSYKATQVTDVSGSQLTVIGFYEKIFLSGYLAETTTPQSPVITSSAGVAFSYDPNGSNLLPDHTLIFGSEDANNPAPQNGLSDLNDWVNIHFNYASGKTLEDFKTEALFNADHYIYVHLQSTAGTTGSTSEKWKLTWEDDGTTPPIDIPEPEVLALLGIGLLGMASTYSRRKTS